VEIEPELAVEPHTKCPFSPVTHWMVLPGWPKTLGSEGKGARIMPSRTLYLGNPGTNATHEDRARSCRARRHASPG
jgi:hypothetical protein